MKLKLIITFVFFCINMHVYELAVAVKTVHADRELSDLHVKKALAKIDSFEYKRAFYLIKKAIHIDPANEEAKQLYVSLVQIVNESIPEPADQKKQLVQHIASRRIVSRSVAPPVSVGLNEEPVILQKEKQVLLFSLISELEVSAGMQHTSLYSRNSDRQNTGIFYGGSFKAKFYLLPPSERFGFALDYFKSVPLNSGSDVADLDQQRVRGSLLYRRFFFEKNNHKTTIRANVSYHYFSQNNNDMPITYFNLMWGPGIGLYIADPVFARFMDSEYWHRIQVYGESNYYYVLQNNNIPLVLDLETGVSCRIAPVSMSLSYSYFVMSAESVEESYSSVKFMVHYLW